MARDKKEILGYSRSRDPALDWGVWQEARKGEVAMGSPEMGKVIMRGDRKEFRETATGSETEQT